MSIDPAAVSDLRTMAATRLKAAKGNRITVRAAIAWYLEEGYQLGLSPSELIDYFCVSTPSIFESAGFDELEGDEITRIFDDVHAQRRRHG